MKLIPCPFCGPRSDLEFRCEGPDPGPRPGPDSRPASPAISDAASIDRLIMPDNSPGPLVEIWWHDKGCGSWFWLCRDTVTHALLPLPAGGRL